MNLPNAIIIGAQKCGTSSLFYSLVKHSNINGPVDPESYSLIKEVDYFYSDIKYNRGDEWYKSLFNAKKGMFLEASPNYATRRYCYSRMHTVVPDAKLILCIRNPINRAYSQYNHYKQILPLSKNWDWECSQDFLTNIKSELRRRNDVERNFDGFLSKGIYILQIKELMRYYKQSQIFISLMDLWPLYFEEELKKVLTFLGQEIELLPNQILHKRPYTVEPLGVREKRILKEFYRPYNEELFNFLGYEIPDWN